jgi:Zn-dependent peptidase ImmA (M78 family)
MSVPSTESILSAVAQMRALVGNTVPVPLGRLFQSLGYSLSTFNPRDRAQKRVSGLVDHDAKAVLVNGAERPERQRFTAAHELGHILLTPGHAAVEYRDEKTKGDPTERAIDHFAAELLMPTEPFKAVWLQCGGSVSFAAEYFQVSKPAARKRAEELAV